MVGPLLSGFLLKLGLSVPFWFAAALETLNIAFTVFVLRDAPRPASSRGDRRTLVDVLLDARMLNLMARQFCYIFAFTYFFTLFGLYLDRRLQIDSAGAALLLAAAGTVGALMLIFGVDRLARRFGDFGLSQIAFVVAFLAYALAGFVTSLPLFAVVLVLWAASGSALRPTLNKMIADAAPAERRGAMLGFADSLSNASMIFAPAAGSAILGFAPQFSGIVPALSVAAGFALGIAAVRRKRY